MDISDNIIKLVIFKPDKNINRLKNINNYNEHEINKTNKKEWENENKINEKLR